MLKIQKYIDKYKNIPIQMRASFFFLVCGVIQNGLSIITLPLFTRILTTAQYGISSTFFAWNDIVVVIATLRLSYGAFDKGLLKFQNERDRFTSAMLGLTTTISVAAFIIFLIFHTFIEKITGLSFSLCSVLFSYQIFSPALQFWTARNKFEMKYKLFTIVTLLSAAICTFVNLIAVIYVSYDRGIVKIISYEAVWSVVNIITYIIIFKKGRTYYRKDIWKFALNYNLPLIPYFFSTIILDKADRIMINHICGADFVALYSVSYNLGRLMVLLTSSIDATFTPWMYQKLKSKDYRKEQNVVFSISLLFMSLAFIFMLFAPELIKIFAAEQYSQAVYVIPPVIASYFFVCIYGMVSKIEFYFEKTKMIAAISVGGAIVNIILNYFGIHMWGYVAAGYTTLICYILNAIGHVLYSRYLCRINNVPRSIFPWNNLLLMGVIMIVLCVLVNSLYTTTFLRYTILLIIFIIAFIKRSKIISLIKEMKK